MKIKFKNTYAWVIKHKKANHMVRSGIYQDKADAQDDFEDMPEYDYNCCGKREDYEIIRVRVITK